MQDVLGQEYKVGDLIVYGLRRGDSGALATGLVVRVDETKGKLTCLTCPNYLSGVIKDAVFNEARRGCVIGRGFEAQISILHELRNVASSAYKGFSDSWDGKKHNNDLYTAASEEFKKFKAAFEDVFAHREGVI